MINSIRNTVSHSIDNIGSIMQQTIIGSIMQQTIQKVANKISTYSGSSKPVAKEQINLSKEVDFKEMYKDLKDNLHVEYKKLMEDNDLKTHQDVLIHLEDRRNGYELKKIAKELKAYHT